MRTITENCATQRDVVIVVGELLARGIWQIVIAPGTYGTYKVSYIMAPTKVAA